MQCFIDLIDDLKAEFRGMREADDMTKTEMSFEDFKSIGVFRVGNSGLEPRPLSRHSIRNHIRNRTTQLTSSESAFAELEQSVQSNSGIAKFHMLLTGFRVDHDIPLTSEFSLQPITSIKFPPWLAETVNKETNYLSNPDAKPLLAVSALVWTVTFTPAFTLKHAVSEQPTEQQQARLDIAADLLATAVCQPIGAVVVWISDDDKTLPIPGNGMTYRRFSWGLSGVITQEINVDLESIKWFFQSYAQFTGDVQAINLAISRISRCVGVGLLEDRAIDLGIALEALLMFEPTSQQRKVAQEISYKIGSRAAWLLGKDVEDRKRIFTAIRKLYTLRSTAAHGNHFKTKDLNKVLKDLNDGILMARAVIRTILENGKWINWTELVLGADKRTFASPGAEVLDSDVH